MLIPKSCARSFLCLFAGLLMHTHDGSSQPSNDHFIQKLLKKHPDRFGKFLSRPEAYGIQIIYTKIDYGNNGRRNFSDYHYGDTQNRYFYPASSIKLAAAVLALEKLNQLAIPGLDRNTTMLVLSDRPAQTEALLDSTSGNGLPSVGHYIRKLLLASDNDAYNRLYEFLGQSYFNETMLAKGYKGFRATHRLEAGMNYEENRYTNPVRFVRDNKVVYEQKGAYSDKDYAAGTPVYIGKGYVEGGRVVNSPMDFAKKNAFPLMDQQIFLRNLMFPGEAPPHQKFNLAEDDYRFLYQYMSQLPIETTFPEAYHETMDDAAVKFLLFGKTTKRIPRQIRSFNKIGEAYGYLVDNAFIADFEKGVEFLLSAVIYCNEDGVLNDDRYEYDPVGYQFMADLGKTILEYELARKRRERPDLERFEVEYDK
ncbi:hypothetical protein GCM10023091_08870 [Ravibacter arvi]|uniref:Beta-lactamase class A catalytic domain-containing protein n=1 Tax=Ravibacter arvi TaxID=2051041 RepID=A0ABP8LTH0_9BACT